MPHYVHQLISDWSILPNFVQTESKEHDLLASNVLCRLHHCIILSSLKKVNTHTALILARSEKGGDLPFLSVINTANLTFIAALSQLRKSQKRWKT